MATCARTTSDSDGGSTRPTSPRPEHYESALKRLKALAHYVIEELAEQMSDGQPRDSVIRARFLVLRQQVHETFSQLSGELRDVAEREWRKARTKAEETASLVQRFWTWFKQKVTEVFRYVKSSLDAEVNNLWKKANKSLMEILFDFRGDFEDIFEKIIRGLATEFPDMR